MLYAIIVGHVQFLIIMTESNQPNPINPNSGKAKDMAYGVASLNLLTFIRLVKANSSKAGRVAYLAASFNLLFFLHFILSAQFDDSLFGGLVPARLVLILCLNGILNSCLLFNVGSVADNSKRSAEFLKRLVREKE